MKKGLFTLFVCAVTTTIALGQGQINFDNRTSVVGHPALVTYDSSVPAALVRNSEGLVGPDYVAQLYLASDPLTAATAAAPSSFRALTTSLPGTWSGGVRDLISSIANNTTVDLVVKVWQGSLYATYEDALASNNITSLIGTATFSYDVPGVGAPPGALVMDNFNGLAVVPVPEPSVFALAILGVGALLFRLRKK